MSPKTPKLRSGVGAVASLMSKFVHSSRSIRHKYPNRPKNHNLQGVILVEVDAKVVWRGADAIMVFVFTHFDFPDEQFYAAKRYIHVTQEGKDDSLFVLVESFIPAVSAGSIGPLKFDKTNHANGEEENDAPILLSVRTSNLRSEDMVELRRQGISIDNDNNPAPENVLRKGENTNRTGNWRREGIICPRKAGNLQNSFAFFRHYSHDAILCMSLLWLFLVMFPEEYIEEFLIPETNKGLIVPMDIQEYIQWVDCWLYMALWVGIESRRDLWSTTTPSMAKGAPFRLNRIMSRNWFDYILVALRFTNREVPYEDGFLKMRQ